MIFLGHRVTAKGVEPEESKIEKVRDWPTPQTSKQLQSFLGFVNFYIEYIPMCSELTGPLYAAASEEQFPLSKEHEELIRKLKEAILTKPLLAHPDLNKPFIYTSDASNNACGGVLSQIQPDGREIGRAHV